MPYDAIVRGGVRDILPNLVEEKFLGFVIYIILC